MSGNPHGFMKGTRQIYHNHPEHKEQWNLCKSRNAGNFSECYPAVSGISLMAFYELVMIGVRFVFIACYTMISPAILQPGAATFGDTRFTSWYMGWDISCIP